MALPTMATPVRSMARSILTMAALATSTMTMRSMTALATVSPVVPASADTVAMTMAALATVSPVMPASADTVAAAMAAVEAMAVEVEATANRGIALVDRIGPATLSSVGSMRASRYPQQVRSGR